MREPIISVSGLRGVVGESLTPLVALRYVAAFAEVAPTGPIVVSRDGRATGGPLADCIRGGLLAAGRDCVDAGVAATPTTGVLVRQFSAAGGIQISASHNPPEYNGLKLFSREGRVIPASAGERVAALYRSGAGGWVRHDAYGRELASNDTLSRHLELVLATVDVERIRRRRFKVLLDSNHGSGSLLGARLLEALGCQAVIVGAEPDGRFEHPPEPTAENLGSVASQIDNQGADIGFCQDPDADRLAIIDENGRYLGEEYTLALCAAHVLHERLGAVVTNCSTSRMTQDIAAEKGVPFLRSAVGEANVVDVMCANQAVLGGEGNGGVIDPRVGYVRDSFVGMALVLDA
ncbi:MAG: phosphoglucosamine mutase, partial [Pirellulales bacterium]